MATIPPPPDVSEQAMEAATGKSWHEWYQLLENAGARRLSHKEIVAWIAANTDLTSFWWQQSVTVQYEKAAGLRAAGQTASGSFQLGVRRTVALDREPLWSFITSAQGMELLLGCAAALPDARGGRLGGDIAELRVRVDDERFRLKLLGSSRWPDSVLQVRVDPAKTGTTLGIHHENLADEPSRDEARAHFTQAAEAIRDRFA